MFQCPGNHFAKLNSTLCSLLFPQSSILVHGLGLTRCAWGGTAAVSLGRCIRTVLLVYFAMFIYWHQYQPHKIQHWVFRNELTIAVEICYGPVPQCTLLGGPISQCWSDRTNAVVRH